MDSSISADASAASAPAAPNTARSNVIDPGTLIHEAPVPADGILPNAGKPKFYLICYNVSKRTNIGNIMRSACAFGAAEILVIGSSGNKMQYFGAQGTQNHVTVRMFLNFKSIVAFVKTQDCAIVGIEIRDDSEPIASHPFTGNTAFILGNEGHGLDAAHAKYCDSFVYIPHYGAGTASLNVTVAGSIIFSHFGMWAGYTERERQGEKFVVQKISVQKGPTTEFEIRKHEERKARKLQAAGGVREGAASGDSTAAAAEGNNVAGTDK